MDFGTDIPTRSKFGRRWINFLVLVENGKISREDANHVSWCALDYMEQRGDLREKPMPTPTGDKHKDDLANFEIEGFNKGNEQWRDDLIRYQNEVGFKLTEFQKHLYSHLMKGTALVIQEEKAEELEESEIPF